MEWLCLTSRHQAVVPGKSSWILYYRVWQWPEASCASPPRKHLSIVAPRNGEGKPCSGNLVKHSASSGMVLVVLGWFVLPKGFCYECECCLWDCLLKEAAVIINQQFGTDPGVVTPRRCDAHPDTTTFTCFVSPCSPTLDSLPNSLVLDSEKDRWLSST